MGKQLCVCNNNEQKQVLNLLTDMYITLDRKAHRKETYINNMKIVKITIKMLSIKIILDYL